MALRLGWVCWLPDPDPKPPKAKPVTNGLPGFECAVVVVVVVAVVVVVVKVADMDGVVLVFELVLFIFKISAAVAPSGMLVTPAACALTRATALRSSGSNVTRLS